MFADEDWTAAWIHAPASTRPKERSVPCVRREFTPDKPIERARLYVSALGLYEARLNGERVGTEFFSRG